MKSRVEGNYQRFKNHQQIIKVIVPWDKNKSRNDKNNNDNRNE